MKKHIKFYITFILLVLTYTGICQVYTKTFSEKILEDIINFKKLNENKLIVNLPANAAEAFLKYKIGKTTNNFDYFTGMPFEVNIDFFKHAKKTLFKDVLVYNLNVEASNTSNISAQFSKFKLSKNAKLSIFNNKEVTDNITALENNTNNVWATIDYKSNFIHLQFEIPIDEEGESQLFIENLIIGFNNNNGQNNGNLPGEAASCNVPVCQGDSYPGSTANAVALILDGYGGTSTGTLVMNTCGTNIPYLLMAKHSLKDRIYEFGVFIFKKYTSSCTPAGVPNGTYTQIIQFNGCNFRADNDQTDFALVELNQIPAANSGITYAGWDRTGNYAGFYSLHHPKGDIMCKSTNYSTPSLFTYGTNPSAVPNHIMVTFALGVVQPGSSGGGYFSSANRLLGQHYGYYLKFCGNNPLVDNDNDNCWCVQQPRKAQYGRFAVSWDGGGTNDTRLSNWLDPKNTNSLTTNTTNVSSLKDEAYYNSSSLVGNTVICNSEDYLVTNLPSGINVGWSINSSAGPVLQLTPNVPAANQLRITNQKWYTTGATLTANFSNICVSPISKPIYNDNATSGIVTYPFFQESCYYYGGMSSLSVSVTSNNNSPAWLHKGCMVYLYLGSLSGQTVSLAPWSATPNYWGLSSGTSYYPNGTNLIFQPGSSGGPTAFIISGPGSCYTKTIMFFTYTSPFRYSFVTAPNPVNYILNVTAIESKKEIGDKDIKQKINNKPLQFVMNIYDVNFNKLQLTNRSNIGSLKHSINTSKLKKGYYVLQIIEGNEKQNFKFYKE